MSFSFARASYASAGAAIGIIAVSALCYVTDRPPVPGDCDGYELLNPYIRCEPEENLMKKKEFSDFKRGLMDRIYSWIGQGRIEHASVYLRDLEFGPWMGIDEEETYGAASLLKVAVMLTLLRQEELRPGTLQQRIEVTPEMMSQFEQHFGPERSISPGNVYTLEQLMEYMIVDSDNNATNVISMYLASLEEDMPPLMRTLEELGFIGQNKEDDSLTVKQSASLFRLLYNSSYLDKDMSDRALSLLTRTTFDHGIVAGVPSGITIAHKFGERIGEGGSRQLHDCGIVYHPDGAYMLCVMTRGKDPEALAAIIADISRMVYDEMHARADYGRGKHFHN